MYQKRFGIKNLFVFSHFRFQSGAKIVAITQKAASWDAINESISKLKDISRDDFENLGRVLQFTVTVLTNQELDNFCVQLGDIQNTLAKVLTYISVFQTEDKPKEKGFGSALKKMGGTLAAFAKSRMVNA
jgi:hypothetical protein